MGDAMWEDWGFNATIARVQFTGRPFDHRAGLYVRTLSGLTGGGRVSTQAPAGRAGIYATPGIRDTPREIRIAGFGWAPTPGVLAALRRQFLGILVDETEFGLFQWEDLDEVRRTWVQRNGASTFERRGRTGFADFDLALTAPDQRVSGDPLETSGWGQTVEVTNRGTYPAPVSIDVRGTSAGGYQITGPKGHKAIVTRALAVGADHAYDAEHGILTVGGIPDPTGVSRSDQLEIPRGTSTVTVTAGAEIQVRGFDTYTP